MKRKLIAMLAITGLMVCMTAPATEAPKLKDIPTVAKCLEFHQFVAIAHNSADPRAEADLNRYVKENFTDEQMWAYNHQLEEWYKDSDIQATYKSLLGPDIYGWSLTPAIKLAACIKVM